MAKFNNKVYTRIFENIIEEALQKGGVTTSGALDWINSNKVKPSSVLFTRHPTGKGKAILDAHRFLINQILRDESERKT